MSKLLASSVLGIATIGLLAGCPDRTISEVNPEQGRVESKSFPINLNRDVDILFVIDDSGSMADKQASLRENFPNFINVLNTIQGGLPDVHIGVVTSDMGAKGEDDASPGSAVGQVGNGGCANTGKSGNLQRGAAPLNGAEVFISDIKNTDGTRQKNYAGDLATVFGQMASVGIGGCGFEQHLHAMKKALDGNGANAGFLRQDAFLAVIFLADEDDCSMAHSTLLGADGGPLGPQQSFRCTRFGIKCEVGGATDAAMNQVGVKDQCHPDDASAHLQTVSKYVSFLKGLKDDDQKVIVAGILGTIDPFAVENRTINMQSQPALAHSCTFNGATGPQVADPPIRLQFFLDQFPNRSTSTTICQQDLSGGLQLIGELLKESLGNPCITGDILDTDEAAPGLQAECSVSYITNFGKANATEEILPECDAGLGNKPCWHLLKDATLCPCAVTDLECNPADQNENLILKIEDDVAQPDGTQVVAGCVTEVN
ncbi:MAG: hypothetical protein ABI867_34545 [Kofleriaceae bacterium]